MNWLEQSCPAALVVAVANNEKITPKMTDSAHIELRILLGMILYFAVWAVALVPAFAAYARALIFSAKCPQPFRMMLSFFVYLLFSCILISPLALGLAVHEPWRLMIGSHSLFAISFLALYLFSILPGALRFKRVHLASLKAIGYFKNS